MTVRDERLHPPGLSASTWRRRFSLVVLILAASVDVVAAQSTWEVTPYATHVWLAIGDQPNLPHSWQPSLIATMEAKLQSVFHAACKTSVELAPAGIRYQLLSRLDNVTPEDVFDADAQAAQWDKVFLVGITGHPSGYRVQVRELDCFVRRMGPSETSETSSLSLIGVRTAELIAREFSPVVSVYRTEDATALTQLRAGALIRRGNSPALLQPGDVLLPFERRTSGTGKVEADGVRPIDWTYLAVTEQRGGRVDCDIVSGYHQPFRAKRNRRVQQLAIRPRRPGNRSVIRLQTRSAPPQPLVGYEIHERIAPGKTELLGFTDWRGELPIEAEGNPIRMLLLKSGSRVTAKLPIVPGLKDEIVASLTDDRQRAAAEGFLAGIQTALIDLVARRESLTARIRQRIDSGDFDEAQKLIERFRQLPSQADFQRQIQQQQRTLNVTDAQIRRQVDTLFVDTYRILGKYLAPERLRELNAELAAARGR